MYGQDSAYPPPQKPHEGIVRFARGRQVHFAGKRQKSMCVYTSMSIVYVCVPSPSPKAVDTNGNYYGKHETHKTILIQQLPRRPLLLEGGGGGG